MKKLSIILALVMALSCFSITAFAEETTVEETTAEATTVEATTVEETTAEATTAEATTAEATTAEATTAEATTAEATTAEKTTAAPAVVEITVVLEKVDGTEETLVFNGSDALVYNVAAGETITSEAIIAAVKARLDDEGNALIDTEEYVISDAVLAEDEYGMYVFSSVKAESGKTYEFTVCAAEINDVANLATTIGEQLGKFNWASVTKFQVTLINQIINGTKAAIESLCNAEWPTCEDKADATVEATEVIEETPDTGVSAVAGAAVVVLALSATTAVVLRKKED